MDIEFDSAKETVNLAKHDISLNDAIELLEGECLIRTDERRHYGEAREIAYGVIAGRVHVCVYTMRGDVHRIISLRRANRREMDAYYQG
jgi:uncharacterized DUF497 family protein